MGNQLTCMASNKSVKNSQVRSRRDSNSRSKSSQDELLQQQQALALALLHQQHKSVARGERAMSQRYNNTSADVVFHRGKNNFSRSSSTRPRSLTDPEVYPHQFLGGTKECVDVSNLESKKFVLVHGGGYGAWCWYKTIALLEECGFEAKAIDLTGSGIESTDPNSIVSLAQYAKPLSDYLESLSEGDKVILVGHDFGGACVSYAMELQPKKISKAVFIAAAMTTHQQRALDVFVSELSTPDDMLSKAQVFCYANGASNPPTSLSFNKEDVKELFFNRSPAKDVALASVSLRPVPFAPVLERLSLSEERYGSVRRFYVQTTDDNALTPELQERLVGLNRPESVFKLKGSDHSPFFSKPHALHKVLVEIAQ